MSRFVYDLDCSNSGWRLLWNISGGAHIAGEFPGLCGRLVFDAEDTSACRLQLQVATEQEKLFQFTSWRFRKTGEREYWIAGPLALGKLTRVVALRLHGPVEESENIRFAAATAFARAPISSAHPVVRRLGVLSHGRQQREVILDFNLKLVLRSEMNLKSAAA
jgi:hypothetical protein